MPQYDVTSPEGKTFRVTAPEGATQDQVLAYARSQFSAPHSSAQASPQPASPAAPPPAAPKHSVGYRGGIENAFHQVAEDFRGDVGGDRKGIVSSFLHPMSPGGALRPIKEIGDVAGAAASLTGIPQGNQYIKDKTKFDLLEALGGLGGEAELVGRAGNLAEAAPRVSGPPAPSSMDKALQALRRQNIKPSTIMTTDSKDVREFGQNLGANLFMGAPVRQAMRRTVQGVQDAIGKTAAQLGEAKSPNETGKAIKDALKGFMKAENPAVKSARQKLSPEATQAVESAARSTKSNQPIGIESQPIGFRRKAGILYDRVDRLTGQPSAMVPMNETQAAINDMRMRTTDPARIDTDVHPEVLELAQRVASQNGKMTMAGLRDERRMIREKLKADPTKAHTATDAEITKLYNAMTSDLQNGAELLGGKAARHAQVQADNYYRAGIERRESALAKALNEETTPEAVFYDLVRHAQEGRGGDLRSVMRLRRSMTPDQWHDVSSSILEYMGRSNPGQGTLENEYSFRTFLTNFNKLEGRTSDLNKDTSMADNGLKVLFQGAGIGKKTYQDLKDIQVATGKLRELDKLYNHSMSGKLGINTRFLSGVGAAGAASAALHNPIPALLSIAGVMTGNLASLALENERLADFMASIARTRPTAQLSEVMPELKKLAKADKALVPLVARLEQQGEQNERPTDQ